MTINCLCGHESTQKYNLKSNIYRCNRCRLQFANDVKFNMEFVSDLDESTRFEALRSLRMSNFNNILGNLEVMLPKKAKGLEIGSAHGWFMEMAIKKEFECFGIEPEESMWDVTKHKGLNVIQGFFPQDLPDDFNNFDFIIFNDVLEHIPDVNTVLNKCYNVLSKDGVLVINIPLSSGFFYKTAELLYYCGIKSFLNRMWQFDFHSPHFFYFNRKNLIQLLEGNKFYLEKYHNLDTIHRDSIVQRISIDKKLSKYSKILTPMIKVIYPLIKYFNEDIGCFYFKKTNSF